jgi:N6-L-threonylcarbamoyladenine synthase
VQSLLARREGMRKICPPPMLVLGIETSCDETAAAVLEDGRRLRSDVVASQVLVHAEFGGVVPEVASRQHLATVVPVLRRAVADAGVTFADLDGLAVTCGPGLVGALLVGVEVAKALGYALGKPVVGVNHLAGHLAAAFIDHAGHLRVAAGQPVSAGVEPATPPFPHLALLVSGGHTMLLRCKSPVEVELLGATRDDAAGEAFDKVAKLLGLGYPGGVAIDRLAATGDPQAHAFPRALARRDDLDFSFSGLKTAVATFLRDREPPQGQELADVCASFQAAVVDVLVRKSRRALQLQGLSALVVCGGVAANRGLRASLVAASAEDGFGLHIPSPRLCTDNAAMIAAAGTELLRRGRHATLELGVDPGLPL